MNQPAIKPRLDLYRYIGQDCNKLKLRLRYYFFTAGYRYIYLWRKASNSGNTLSRLFWTFLCRQCMLSTGIQIPVGTKIGPGLRISHFGQIVINPGAIIGRNFSIAQGCLIGNSAPKTSGGPTVPTIGDRVIMGANSIIIGGVNIGNDVLIAPGAMVNMDIPDNSIAIGNPAKIISRDTSPTDKFNVYLLPEDNDITQ